ncbi:MAG: PEP-CTERM sorting domain-containing protein [Opitutaceae bacterium]|jgi:hypothetical protein|nr:PEP-CTERM sorting domain-containing protein [Opitutaceae bacterium]
MKTKSRPASLGALAALLLLVTIIAAPLPAQTTVLLNDTFADAAYAAPRDTNVVPYAGDWKIAGGATLTVNDTTGLPGQALAFTATSGSSDSSRMAYTAFGTTTLAAAGDSLSVSFSLKGTTWASNNSNRVIFGFFNNNDTAGYIGAIRADLRTDRNTPYSQFAGLNTGPSFTLADYGSAVLAAAVASGDTQFYLNGAVTEEGTTGNSGDIMQFSYSITRQANGDLLLSQTFTNTATSASYTSTATVVATDVLTYEFDTLAIGHLRRDAVFAIDDVSVAFTAGASVPEPATMALLLGLGGLSGAFFWRRGRH